MALRLGLVGRGRWGQIIERTLLSFAGVSIRPIAKGERPPARIDGVVIATPSATHAEVALPYVEAGIATFIEKPMATATADAERLREAAERSGAVVFVGHIFLYNPAFRAALSILPDLGPIRYVICEGMNDKPRTDSSVLWDWLPHDLSMARAMLGREPDRVAAWSLFGGANAPKAAAAMYEFGGVPLLSQISWLSPVSRRTTTAVCDKGTLVFDDKAPRRIALYWNNGETAYPNHPDDLPLTLEMTAFLRAVESRNADASTLDDGVAVIRAIAAAEKSLSRDGKSVEIYAPLRHRRHSG